MVPGWKALSTIDRGVLLIATSLACALLRSCQFFLVFIFNLQHVSDTISQQLFGIYSRTYCEIQFKFDIDISSDR